MGVVASLQDCKGCRCPKCSLARAKSLWLDPCDFALSEMVLSESCRRGLMHTWPDLPSRPAFPISSYSQVSPRLCHWLACCLHASFWGLLFGNLQTPLDLDCLYGNSVFVPQISWQSCEIPGPFLKTWSFKNLFRIISSPGDWIQDLENCKQVLWATTQSFLFSIWDKVLQSFQGWP